MSNQHGTLDALCRIPHHLTPREKVEYWLDLALTTGANRQDFNMSEAVSAILAALASSGDHAELADRLLNVSLRWDDADQEREEASRAITALIAEVAALRGEVETLTTAGIVEVAVRNPSVSDYVQHWEGRANEAERKLAEAMGLHERAAELMRQCTDPERFEGTGRSGRDRPRQEA